ncbi:MAG: oxidoreductase [Mesorhizobium amorphae]|nr:MAG: oxidoreductase [Mesorhizobium amorphae]
MSIFFQNTFQRAFGTFPLDGDKLEAAIGAAIEAGYRAFDTAQMYGNEKTVGKALEASGVPRDELCITTKIGTGNFGRDRFMPSLRQSLDDLRIDQADALLVHWPPMGGDIAPSLGLLEEARAEGFAKHIGVSNYTSRMMREARALVSCPLVTNQVEFHPLLDQSVLLAAASETGIPLSAYSTVARGAVFRNPLFAEIGKAYGKTAGQVVLRWILQKGVAVTTMSTSPQNIRANFDVMDWTLSSVDIARIDALGSENHRVVTRALVPEAPDWD